MRRFLTTLASAVTLLSGIAQAGEFNRPWNDPTPALVLDAYGPNKLDLAKIASDPRVAGILHKASQGLTGKDSKYAARRDNARSAGFLWGSYHLLTTQNIKRQVDHYLNVTGLHADETYAIDVECLAGASRCASSSFKVSVAQVKEALRYFKSKTGKFPLLYANGSVTIRLANAFSSDPDLADVRLWYARFKGNISSHFPTAHWSTYRLWQFSSEINCKRAPGSCPYRVPGTRFDMDINAYWGSVADLRSAWPIDR